jgi:uncharacterized protein (DUF1684 family)
MKLKIHFVFILTISFSIFLTVACNNKEQKPIATKQEDNSAHIEKIKKHRAEYDEWMKTSPDSPFNHKTKIEFHPLKYFKIDPDFVFKSKLIPYKNKEALIIYGTKGEARNSVRYGYLTFKKNGKDYKIDVYYNKSKNGDAYYSIWFTDKTTGKESYDVGRYLEFEFNPDTNFVYTIDFNLAFNPYCAYSHDYSCAIPSDKDYLDLAITAGEKKFHE